MRGFFSFDRMITPFIIKFFFWLSVLGVILSSIGLIGFGIISKSGHFLHMIGGVIMLFLGPIIVRMYCEMLIVFFKIQESLVQIRNLLSDQSRTSIAPSVEDPSRRSVTAKLDSTVFHK